jgi:hypothetical protein
MKDAEELWLLEVRDPSKDRYSKLLWLYPLSLTPEDGHTRVSDTESVEGGPKDAGSNTTLYTGVQSRGGEVGPLLTG